VGSIPRGHAQRQYGSQLRRRLPHRAAAKGHTRPGEVLFGTDSHTCMAGAFNEFATGIGNTDAGFVMGTGKLLLKVPETMHFRLEGPCQPGVMAKDIILHCIGEIGFDGATYRAMQFDGPGVASLSMDDRMTIANMAIEAGGKNGIFEFDARTGEYVDARCKLNGTKRLRTGRTAMPTRSSLRLVVDSRQARTDRGLPSRSRPAQAGQGMGDVKLDRAYIGSCTGGKTSDFVEFARVLRGRQGGIDTFGVPATPDIVRDLQTRVGGTDDLGDPGGCRRADDGERRLRRVPGRAGGHLRPDEHAGLKCISATNRNFPGRMGHKESQVFLASARTVAASAITGKDHRSARTAGSPRGKHDPGHREAEFREHRDRHRDRDAARPEVRSADRYRQKALGDLQV
jgi:3-isopropylmalate/(R)-2-methylmalate dehydratase large subunit